MKHLSKNNKQKATLLAFLSAVILFLSSLILLPIKATTFAQAETTAIETNGNSYSFSKLLSCSDRSGYTNPQSLSVGDPLVGVNVAEIRLENFSATTVKEGKLYFLKTTPDIPVLSIVPLTDFNNLGGTGTWINEDGDTRIPDFGFIGEIGYGWLGITHKDYQGKIQTVCVSNVLRKTEDGISFTPAWFGEEGSYRIALCFEVKRQIGCEKKWDWWPFKYHYDPIYSFTNYKIDTQFEIRNANAQVFAFDSKGNELLSGAVSNQFTLDFANSRYLQINIKREIAVNSNELMESSDVRFNSVGVDKRTYDTPGVWTITARNEVTGDSTTRRILVIDSNDTEEANALKVATSKKYSEFSSLNVKNNNEEVNISNEKIVSENKDGIVVTIIVSATVVVLAVIISAVIIKKKNY